LLSLENVSFTFGGKLLFEDITIHIAKGDRISLVGRNGSGKTTLMKLIAGELETDSGKLYVYPSTQVGYLPQKVDFVASHSVKEFVLSGLDAADRYEKEYLADIVIEPLGLNENALMASLSGGQVRRASLARALVSQPDILLLDEPTNHLDLSAIEWLENYLSAYRGAVLCVSHDRAFLTNISSKVFWIDRSIIRTCPKGYKEFESWAETILEQEEREIQNMQKKLELEHQWTQGGVTARRKRNQRRLRELYALRDKLKNDKAAYNQTIKTISLDPIEPTQASKIIAEFKNVSKSFTTPDGLQKPILSNFNLRIMRGDRLGILGKNGSGKTTFLKLLVGDLEPDSGRLALGKTVSISYFDQNRVSLDTSKSIWKILCPDGGDYVYLGSGAKQRPRHVCGYLKDFLFDPKIARDSAASLSGGQQSRLMLAKIVSNPTNVMILDEPTNDLDIETLDMLQEIISDYEGTLVIVSHDRDFLDRTVTKVLAFEGDCKVEGFMGGYSDYMEQKKRLQAKPEKDKNKARTTEDCAPEKPRTKPELTFKLKYELQQAPIRAKQLEDDISAMKALLADSDFYSSDPVKFDSVVRKLSLAEEELDTLMQRWIYLEGL